MAVACAWKRARACYVDHKATVSMLGYYYITHQRGMIVYHVARQAGFTYRDRRRSETQHQPVWLDYTER